MRTALLLIDIQNDYFPGGKNELTGSIEASLNGKKLLETFRKNGLMVIHVQHISRRAGATFFLPDTTGCEIHNNVKPLAGETIIVKNYPNSFRETSLNDILRVAGIERLIICGMMTHMCVDSTVRAAYDLSYNCIVAEDACATKKLVLNNEEINAIEIQKSFMSAFNGMFATVKKTDEIIVDLRIS